MLLNVDLRNDVSEAVDTPIQTLLLSIRCKKSAIFFIGSISRQKFVVQTHGNMCQLASSDTLLNSTVDLY